MHYFLFSLTNFSKVFSNIFEIVLLSSEKFYVRKSIKSRNNSKNKWKIVKRRKTTLLFFKRKMKFSRKKKWKLN